MKTILLSFALSVVILTGCGPQSEPTQATVVDATIAPSSKFPNAARPEEVGNYPYRTNSGAGFFYDEVLEYRVWCHPEQGAQRLHGEYDYFAAFASYAKALEFSRVTEGAEAPLVLVLQKKWINEPKPKEFEVKEGHRLTEWFPDWLEGAKREEGSIDSFLKAPREPRKNDK